MNLLDKWPDDSGVEGRKSPWANAGESPKEISHVPGTVVLTKERLAAIREMVTGAQNADMPADEIQRWIDKALFGDMSDEEQKKAFALQRDGAMVVDIVDKDGVTTPQVIVVSEHDFGTYVMNSKRMSMPPPLEAKEDNDTPEQMDAGEDTPVRRIFSDLSEKLRGMRLEGLVEDNRVRLRELRPKLSDKQADVMGIVRAWRGGGVLAEKRKVQMLAQALRQLKWSQSVLKNRKDEVHGEAAKLRNNIAHAEAHARSLSKSGFVDVQKTLGQARELQESLQRLTHNDAYVANDIYATLDNMAKVLDKLASDSCALDLLSRANVLVAGLHDRMDVTPQIVKSLTELKTLLRPASE